MEVVVEGHRGERSGQRQLGKEVHGDCSRRTLGEGVDYEKPGMKL